MYALELVNQKETNVLDEIVYVKYKISEMQER